MILYLTAAYPGQKEKLWKDEQEMQALIAVWHNILYVFPIEVTRQAAQNYINLHKPFFPSLAEIAGLCDDAWRAVIDNQRENDRQAEKDAAKLLFHAPLDNFTKNYSRLAVSLIRRVVVGEIKFGSDDWKKEYKSIFPEYNPITGRRIADAL